MKHIAKLCFTAWPWLSLVHFSGEEAKKKILWKIVDLRVRIFLWEWEVLIWILEAVLVKCQNTAFTQNEWLKMSPSLKFLQLSQRGVMGWKGENSVVKRNTVEHNESFPQDWEGEVRWGQKLNGVADKVIWKSCKRIYVIFQNPNSQCLNQGQTFQCE